MNTVIGLALILAIAYGLLRLLAWLGLCWERGYVFAPQVQRPARQNDLEQQGVVNAPPVAGWDGDPWFNVDGTPVMRSGFMDVSSNLYGTPPKSTDD